MSSGVTSGVETTATESRAERSKRVLEEAFNEGKFDLVDQYAAPDSVVHDPALPTRLRSQHGPELERSIVGLYRSAFPDIRLTVEEVIDGGDSVVLRWRAEGTHRGELEGLAPTGVRVTVTGITIDHWRDDKVVETWNEWDNLGLARQLGAAPPEGSPVEKVGLAVQRLMAARMRKKNP